MTPSETIKLHALQLKATVQGSHPAILDHLIRTNPEEAFKDDFKNVCALVPVPLFDELEGICSMLNLSKREIVNLALRHFFRFVDEIIDEVDPFEGQPPAVKQGEEVSK